MIQITHFRQKCIGCNACVEVNPARWRISKKDGKSVLIGAREKKEIYHFLTSDDEIFFTAIASKNCPVNIIRIAKTKNK